MPRMIKRRAASLRRISRRRAKVFLKRHPDLVPNILFIGALGAVGGVVVTLRRTKKAASMAKLLELAFRNTSARAHRRSRR